MATTADFEEELQQLIAPWQKSADVKPPFTMQELVVIALCLNPPCHNPPCQKYHVLRWIAQNFEYYAHGPMEDADSNRLNGLDHDDGDDTHARYQELEAGIIHAFLQYEMPVEASGEIKPSCSSHFQEFTVPMAAARIVLQDKLESAADRASREPFPFMKLAAELRCLILEYALNFPRTGLHVRIGGKFGVGKELRFVVLDKGMDQMTAGQVEILSHHRRTPPAVHYARPPAIHLALLQTSKQLYREALPIFYGGNNFVFPGVSLLLHFLKRMPESRRDQIRHATVRYGHRSATHAAEAFRALKQLPKLRELDVLIERTLKTEIKRDGTPRYATFKELPGIGTLGTFRGLEAVRFNVDDLKGLIPAMTGEKADQKAKAKNPKPKSRKAIATASKTEGERETQKSKGKKN